MTNKTDLWFVSRITSHLLLCIFQTKKNHPKAPHTAVVSTYKNSVELLRPRKESQIEHLSLERIFEFGDQELT